MSFAVLPSGRKPLLVCSSCRSVLESQPKTASDPVTYTTCNVCLNQ